MGMTKREAVQLFKSEGYYKRAQYDLSALREAWNNFTDSLQRAGQITAKQYDTWDNPF